MELSNADLLYLQIIEDLHKHWMPYDEQVTACQPIVDGKANTVFIQCGRKWGKTDLAIYLLWRWALLNPGSTCYYVAPELQHGRELIWNNLRLQNFGAERDDSGRLLPGGSNPLKKYIASISTTDSRVRFKNKSSIKVIGSENWGAANGLTPDFAVYDEFKVFKKQWHTEFNPNRIVRKAPLVIIGTPPKPGDNNKDQYIEISDQAKLREDMVHVESSSYKNPHVPHDEIDREIAILRQRGEEDVVQREYFGKLVYGGADSIFPMFDEKRHIFHHDDLIQEIKRDRKKLDWFVLTDPGTTTCFAVLLGCINPYTKTVYILDELYETDQRNTSVRLIYPKMELKMYELNPLGDPLEDWYKGYDEAAAWFSNEVFQQYSVYFTPTQKHLHKKEHGISLIKDILVHDLIKISSRCVKLPWEMLNYVKDDKGNIPKKHDHLIDCLRYLLNAANYSMIEVIERLRKKNADERRAYSLREDYENNAADDDWTTAMTKSWKLYN